MDDRSTAPHIGSMDGRPAPELISAARLGDLEAFNRLVLEFQDEIYTLIYRLAPPHLGVQEITQGVVQRMYRDLPGYRGGDFRLWVYKLSVKVCRESRRSKKLKQEEPSDLRNNGGISSQRGAPYARMPDRDERIHPASQEQALMDRLNRLPFKLRLAIVLVDIGGLDYERAAEVIGTSKRDIQARLAKARRTLCQPLTDGLVDYGVKTQSETGI